MIVFECPTCKAKLQVAEEHAGKTIQCPGCNGMAAAPASAGAPADAIAPAVPPPRAEAPTAVTTPKVAQAAQERRREEADPGGDAPRRRDDRAPGKAASKGMGTGTIIMIILGVSACCGLGGVAVLAALLLPAVTKVREAAARTQSMNNLKQIGLAMHTFHDVHRRMPFNGSDQKPQFGGIDIYRKAAVAGSPTSGSWAFQILPYLEQQALFNNVNRSVAVPTYLCPGRGRPMVEAGGGAWSDYYYNNYLNAGFNNSPPNQPDNVDHKRTMVGITDGTSNTVFAAHGNINRLQYGQDQNVTLCTSIFNGGTFGTARGGNQGGQFGAAPTGVFLARDSDAPPGLGNWGGPFPQGGLVLLCDGTVRVFSYNTNNFGEFLTPTGGEAAFLLD